MARLRALGGHSWRRSCWILALALVATPVAAQPFELTPQVGVRLGGSFDEVEGGGTTGPDPSMSLGLTFGIPWNADDHSWLELTWSHQDASLDGVVYEEKAATMAVDYVQVGGSVRCETPSPTVEALLVGSLGGSWLRPTNPDSDVLLGFSGNLGGGFRVCLSDALLLRCEGRVYWTLTSSSTAILCGNNGRLVGISGSGLWQGELSAGLTGQW